MTTLGEESALATESLAARRDWSVSGATWAWAAWCGSALNMNEFRRHLASLVLTCEQHGVTDPDQVPRWAQLDRAAFDFLENAPVTLKGFPETNRPGAIDVLPEGGRGFVPDDVEGVSEWLEQKLSTPALTRKVDKLRATKREVLHLFLRVHDSALPFQLLHGLAFTMAIPTAPLRAPDGLTGVWLAPRWNNPLLRWDHTGGWRREDCLG